MEPQFSISQKKVNTNSSYFEITYMQATTRILTPRQYSGARCAENNGFFI